MVAVTKNELQGLIMQRFCLVPSSKLSLRSICGNI